MATRLQTQEDYQKESDEKQTKHAEEISKIRAARDAANVDLIAAGMMSTKQTTKEHVGKIAADENKPDEMEALKVGRNHVSAVAADNVTKVEQKAIVTSETGEQTEEVVDVIQVPTARAEAGMGIPAGSTVGELTEPDKAALAVEEELGPPVEATPHGEGGGEAAPKRKRRSK
jgi:hypothetical protein